MSVIAKVSIRGIHNYGSGSLVELGRVCENDLMAAYAGSEEDKLFTKYSPWGEIKLHQPGGWIIGQQDDKFYVIILTREETADGDGPQFGGSVAWSSARIASLTDFGDGMAKRVEITDGDAKGPAIGSFNWKMSVDNPGATSQLKPGKSDYFIALYPADKFNRDTAIAAAHGRP